MMISDQNLIVSWLGRMNKENAVEKQHMTVMFRDRVKSSVIQQRHDCLHEAKSEESQFAEDIKA